MLTNRGDPLSWSGALGSLLQQAFEQRDRLLELPILFQLARPGLDRRCGTVAGVEGLGKARMIVGEFICRVEERNRFARAFGPFEGSHGCHRALGLGEIPAGAFFTSEKRPFASVDTAQQTAQLRCLPSPKPA